MALNNYVPFLSVFLLVFQTIDCFQWSLVQESSHVISPYLGSNTTLPCEFSLSADENQQMQQFHVILWSRRTNTPKSNYWQALASITNINSVLDTAPKIIYPEQKKFSLTNNSLVLFNVEIEDEGQYQCEVKSSFYTTPSVVKLNVQYKPVETKLLASKTTVIINKEAFELNCTSRANPKAGYSFFLNGRLVQNSTSHRYAVDKANTENAGEYTCTPWNYYGVGPSATIFIKVEGVQKTDVEQSLSDEVIAGITGAAALAVVIIVVLAIICKRLRDDKKPEPAKSTTSLSPSDATEAHIGPGIYGSEASINDRASNNFSPPHPKLYKLNGSQEVPPDTNM